jgi:hypothetical protein
MFGANFKKAENLTCGKLRFIQYWTSFISSVFKVG